ncbi:hypothetical protein [Vibrio agarivorans]|uniref:hypothetical protein n=1 Tax=Vibrio agarivorans TaxID=153622 RepID=UPI002232337B|nr:hypothetical protein [Vibrio agarivorans]MDN3659851.1 hypothetical protein [Vibrio agarivorans]
MKKFALITPIALVLVANVHAEESAVIDPADVTNVYTQGAIMLNGNSDILLQGQVSGGLSNGQEFALLAEATLADESKSSKRNDNKFGTDYSNSRLQYFHVFTPESKVTPKLGLSVDYINTRNDVKNDLLSIGAIAAINPQYTGGLMLFPRLAVMGGTMEVPSASTKKDDLFGYSASLFIVKRIGDGGAYLNVAPEWQDVSGDEIDMQNFSVKTSLNVPLNSERSWWINTRYDVTKSYMDINNKNLDGNWETQAWVGVRYYF